MDQWWRTHLQCRRHQAQSLVRKISYRGAWQPPPVLLPENPMDRGAWWATVHGVTKRLTRLKTSTTILIWKQKVLERCFFLHSHQKKKKRPHIPITPWSLLMENYIFNYPNMYLASKISQRRRCNMSYSHGGTCKCSSLSCRPTLWDSMDCRSLCPWNSPGKNSGVSCHAFSRIEPRDRTQVSHTAGRKFFTIWATRNTHTKA